MAELKLMKMEIFKDFARIVKSGKIYPLTISKNAPWVEAMKRLTSHGFALSAIKKETINQ